MIYLINICEKPANNKNSKGYADSQWEAIHMEDLKDIKEEIVFFALHSTYVRLLLNIYLQKIGYPN